MTSEPSSRARRSRALVALSIPIALLGARHAHGEPSTPSPQTIDPSAQSSGSSAPTAPTIVASASSATSSSVDADRVALDRATKDDPRSPLGPETAAGSRNFPVKPGLEVFAQYAYRSTKQSDGSRAWFHQFEATRVHASLTGATHGVKGRVLIEGVRSASEGALTGVSGDSMVLRVREAYVAGSPVSWIEARGGIIPSLTVPTLERAWGFRAVAPVPLEQAQLASAADAGVTVRATLPSSLGFVAVAAYNGEGYTNRELNRGKSIEAATELHPLATIEKSVAPIGVFASYIQGSTGTARARADRATAGLVWRDEKVRVGLSYTQAWGVEDSSARRSWLFDAFAHVELIDQLLIGARGFVWQRDTKVDTDRVTGLLATIGWRWAEPLETFVAISRQSPGTRAAQAVPGSDVTELRLVGRAVF